MKPMFNENDRVLISPLIYGAKIPFTDSRIFGFSQPKRGDVIVLLPPYYAPPSLFYRIIDPIVKVFTLQKRSILPANQPEGTTPFTVKRIIGLPGDTIKIENYTVYIKSEGSDYFLGESELIEKNYQIHKSPLPELWNGSFPFSSSYPEITLEKNQFFVIGDNRGNSNDSRFFGPVDFTDIHSKVIFQYWPLKSIGVP